MTTCPCGSGQSYEHCCGPLIAGAPAKTAEALMRSRYTAYTRREIDYLVATHDPSTAGDLDRAATDKWARESQWLSLSVVATEKGGEADDTGVVEFVAKWKEKGREWTHHERSQFRKIDGRWFYSDGMPPKSAPVRREAPAAGPNDPCPCGSGRKFKRCHGT